MEDREIIRLFWERKESAISETDIKYGGKCRFISNCVIKSREDSEECVNDAYLSLWNSIPPGRPDNFPAYLFRIVRNVSISRLRILRAEKRGGGETALILEELSEVLPSSGSVEEKIEAQELAEEINSFIKTLSRNDRLIFMSRYWLALPVQETADRLGMKKARVVSSLHRSREKLHAHLEREGFI